MLVDLGTIVTPAVGLAPAADHTEVRRKEQTRRRATANAGQARESDPVDGEGKPHPGGSTNPGSLANLGHNIGHGTIAAILARHQIGHNLTDAVDGILKGKRYLIHDRGPLFTDEFLRVLGENGVVSVKLPPRSPNLNAHAERFLRTIKESHLERVILFGEASVRQSGSRFHGALPH